MTDLKYAIGLDVGGTKIAGGLVEAESGRLLARRARPTAPERGGEAVLADAVALAGELAEEAMRLGRPAAALGAGVCELVDLEGNVTSGHTVRWRGLPVRERLGAVAPATVESDVRAHALAEARLGAGQPFRQFAFVSIGTGISSCLVLEGRPYPGARGNALVLASGTSPIACRNCGAPLQPPLEEYAAGPALARRYRTLTGRETERAEAVLEAARMGEAEARAVVESAAQALGAALGWLVNVLDPEAVVLGGGLGSAPGLYRERLIEAAREHIWAENSRGLPIVTASLGPEAGVIGAALRALG